MFNRRPLAIVIASALYVGAAATAAGAATPSKPVSLQQVPAAQFSKSSKSAAGNNQQNLRQGRPGGLNQQVRPASSRSKFIAEPDRKGEDVYLVRLHDLPVATYDGRVKGYAATAKSALRAEAKTQSSWERWLNKGKDLVGLQTSEKARIASYKTYLKDKQEQALQAARSKGIYKQPRTSYTNAFNGFSLKLTQAQAKALAEMPEVAYVQRSDMLKMQTDRGPEFIGADQVWNGMSVTGLQQQGEGVLVGIIDSGINTDHPSFADIGGDGYDHTNPRGAGSYLGDCATGVLQCNDKLIGVWSWPIITENYDGIRPPSGEDYNGHGSHTASTTAGNVVYDVPLLGSSIGDGDGNPTGFVFDKVSGVAPHANIVAYQVCIPNGGCPDEAIVKAVDQAIDDGVDVINFSIGGAERFPWEDPIALAFMSAREAGISLAASAGNAGSGFYTLSHSAPWYLIVAATTHDRLIDIPRKTLELSGTNTPPDFWTYDYTEYGGISATGITNGDLVSAADVGAGDELCSTPYAPGTFTSNQIVVCKRGGNARLEKAYNVQAGGAGGFVLYNDSANEDYQLFSDTYPLPGIQLQSWDGEALIAWMADGGAEHKASISATVITRSLVPEYGDQLADFSSRGPSSTYEGILSPGISAPGVDIFAAYADEHPFDPGTAMSRDWAMESGTSMASPHVAGSMTLVRQAHPDWTPAEVQSALQMTAADVVKWGATDWNPVGQHAAQHRAGAGRVDVLAAVNAGLVMDETASNFDMANPRNGGDVKQLNLPQLVNNHCRDVCSWMRTVRATRDGTWTVTAGDFVYDRYNTGEGEIKVNGAKFDIFPSTFTLRAGESKTISFRADLSDTQYRRDGRLHVNTSEEVELWNNVYFTASDPTIPVAHMPMSINFDHGVLPKSLDLTVHRDVGAYTVQDLGLPAMSNVSYRAYGVAKANIQNVQLRQDSDHIPISDDGDYSNENTQTILLNVPAGSARLVVETLKNMGTSADALWKAGWLTIYIGKDSNGNGEADFADELLCLSSTEIELNYCSINNPDAGQYWVVLANVRGGVADDEPVDTVDLYKVATAVVPNTANGLSISGPSSITGAPVNLDLNWSLDDLMEGEVAYAGFDVGTSAKPGSVGFVPVKLTRGASDVGVTTSQTRARGGDVVDVTVHVLANNSGADRNIDLRTTLPAGVTLVPGSVNVSNVAQRANLTVDGNSIRIAGIQQNSEDWARDYKITTSANDASCRTKVYVSNYGQSDGKFVGLMKNLGLMPDFGGSVVDQYNDEFVIALNNFWGDGAGYNLYADEFKKYPDMRVSPQGWVTLDSWAGLPIFHAKFPYYGTPYTPVIAPLWKGKYNDFLGQTADALSTPLNVDWLNPANTSGMVLAYSSVNEDILLEWVGARTETIDFWGAWPPVGVDKGDRYSFDLILNRNLRFGEGEFEIIMAYDDLKFGSEGGQGSIGIHGANGPIDLFGFPLYGETGKSYAFNDLKTKLKNNLVVCYDYVGPESTQFDLSYQVRVAESASGQTLSLQTISDISGMGQQTITKTIEVAGNLQIAAISDQTVAENTTLSGIEVMYNDADAGPNIISVTGANISAKVNGNESGDSFDITPAANFEGTTEVTVTVYDQANPTDKASTTFMLTVTSGTNVNTGSSSKGGGGGSVGLGALALLALLGRRRKARRN